MERGSVPEGTVESLSVRQIFVVETELMHGLETLDTPVEKFGSDDPAVPGEEMAIGIIEESLPRRATRLSPGFQPREPAQTPSRPEGAPH